MHFHQLRKELREITEILRLHCGRRLHRYGFLGAGRHVPRRSRREYEDLLALPVRTAPFGVLDTETTGFEPYGGDEIVQIALIEYRGLEPTGRELSSLVRPGGPIPPRSTAIHGISDAMVADAPSIDELIDDIVHFIDGHVLVGHHIAFDMRFLDRITRRCMLGDLPHPRLDTAMLHLATGGLPDAIGLDHAAAACGIPIDNRHDARGDARACGQLFARLASHLTTDETTVGELIERVHPIAGLSPHHPAEGGVTFSNNPC